MILKELSREIIDHLDEFEIISKKVRNLSGSSQVRRRGELSVSMILRAKAVLFVEGKLWLRLWRFSNAIVSRISAS